MSIKKISGGIRAAAAACIATGTGMAGTAGMAAGAATLDEADIIAHDAYDDLADGTKEEINTAFSLVPDEVVLLHRRLGGTVSMKEKISDLRFADCVDPTTVVGAYAYTNKAIEVKYDDFIFHSVSSLNGILSLTHEYGHFIYALSNKYWDYDTAALMRELDTIMREYSPAECYNESESFCVAYANMKYAEGRRLKGDKDSYFCPWSAGQMTREEFCEKFTPVFKTAEQIIIDLYNGKALEPVLSGPGDELSRNEDLDKKENLGNDVQAGLQEELTGSQDAAAANQIGPGTSQG